MSLDPQGRLWVADTGHSRFAIFKPDGTFVEYWGTKGSGAGQFDLQRANGDGYGAIAFAPDGSFYVLDVGNRRVEHFDTSRHLLKAWGAFGQGPGQFVDPIAIVVDAKGSIHVLDDARGVVETYDRDGKVLGSFDPHLAGEKWQVARMLTVPVTAPSAWNVPPRRASDWRLPPPGRYLCMVRHLAGVWCGPPPEGSQVPRRLAAAHGELGWHRQGACQAG